MSIGTIVELINRIFKKIPIQNRIERIRNQLAEYKREQNELYKQPVTPKTSARLVYIDKRIGELERLLTNAAKDD